jgi:putative oxidoreductase
MGFIMLSNDTWLPLIGRILVSVIFLASGYGKIVGYDGTASYMASFGMPMVPLLLPATIVVELAGAAMVIAGFQARLGALALVGFTVVATLVFHRFWTLTGMDAYMQQIQFMKNLGLIGGLLLIVAFGPGRLSLDRRAA